MMTSRSQSIFSIVFSAILLISNGVRAEDRPQQGGYSPCIVQPVFVKPYLSPALISPGEIEKPVFVGKKNQNFILELADIEPATFVQTVILKPTFEGCDHQSIIRAELMRGFAGYSSGQSLLIKASENSMYAPIAKHVFTDADACCGGSMSKK